MHRPVGIELRAPQVVGGVELGEDARRQNDLPDDKPAPLQGDDRNDAAIEVKGGGRDRQAFRDPGTGPGQQEAEEPDIRGLPLGRRDETPSLGAVQILAPAERSMQRDPLSEVHGPTVSIVPRRNNIADKVTISTTH